MATITLGSKQGRRALIVLEVLVFAGLVVHIARHYLADRWGHMVAIASLQRAARLDPRNSDYLLRLARQEQYNIADLDPDMAVAHLKRAAELNPRDPQSWLELSAAYNFQGNAAEAEACLRRADVLAPNLPQFQWVIGNFFLLQGNVDEAFKHFNVVLAGSSTYNRILFRTAWKASDNGQKILDELIPRRVLTEFDYLYFLLDEKRIPEAQAVWERIAAGSESFDPASAAAFIDRLITAHQPEDALKVWGDLRRRGLIRPTYQPTPQNLIINGDFEEDILNMGFDWRVVPVEGVLAGPEASNFHSPSHALLINFRGKANLNYYGVYHFAPVEPGRSYRLQGFLKVEGITTDSGPRLEVHDAYDANLLQKYSDSLTGTSTGWTQAIIDFTAGPKTQLVAVGVARPPSAKLDNLIAGKVWIDDVRLMPLP